MVSYEVGDYLLTKEGELYRIINKYSHAVAVYYDLKSLRPLYKTWHEPGGQLAEYTEEYTTHHSVPFNRLRHFGSIIKEENAKIVKILYG